MNRVDDVTIRLLGRFHILVNGESVQAQLCKSRKGVSLLQLLILQNGEPVPNQKLYESLCYGEKTSRPENALKTLISRFRTILGEYSDTLAQCIVTERGSYSFSRKLGIHVDLYEAQALVAKLQQQETLTEDDLPVCEELMKLYSGDLLADGNGSEEWAMNAQMSLHTECYQVFYRYIDLLMSLERYDEVVYACRHLLEIDNFDERLQLNLMDAMLKKGNINEALMQHKHATEIYYKYLGVQPPDTIRDFYTKIISADKSLEDSLDKICTELENTANNSGAFICEYAIFKEIYSLQVRSAGRTAFDVYVMLVMLQKFDGSSVEAIKLSSMMDRLQQILRTSLRRGDVISRFSASKFALLLPMDHKDSGDIVMERVKRTFYKEFGRSDVVISYRISDIDKVKEMK